MSQPREIPLAIFYDALFIYLFLTALERKPEESAANSLTRLPAKTIPPKRQQEWILYFCFLFI